MAGFSKAQLLEREAIKAIYNHACAGCGSPLDLEIDHVIPVSKGGPDTRENKQVLCHHCNNAKNGTDGLPKLAPREAIDSCAEIAKNRENFRQWLRSYK